MSGLYIPTGRNGVEERDDAEGSMESRPRSIATGSSGAGQ